MAQEVPQIKHPILLIASVMLATLMFAVDTTIANVILPHLQGGLQASRDQLGWVLTSYIVVSAIVTPLLSPLSDRFGVSTVMRVSIVMFTLSSALCGLAVNLPEMVAFRMLQGASGAALVPLSQSILLSNFPKEQHGKLLGIWTVGIMAGPILGPTLGGILTEYYNWRWVFLINLPVGILSFLGVATSVPKGKTGAQRPFDVKGYLFIATAIGAFQLFIDRGSHEDWFDSTEILIEALLAGFCFYMFIVHSLTTRNPFFTPALFTDRNFVIGSMLICLILVSVYGSTVLLPMFLQELRGYTVLDAGMLLAPRGIGLALSSLIAGRLLSRYSPRYFIFIGILCSALSLHMMSQYNLNVSSRNISLSVFIQGAGIGLITVPLMTYTFSTLNPLLQTEASALYSILRNLGASIGVSTSMTILSTTAQSNQSFLVQDVSIFDTGKWQLLYSLFGSHAEEIIAGEIHRQAETMAYLANFNIICYISLLGIPLLLLMRSNTKVDKELT